MPSEPKKSSELSRITFSLDAFDERVITMMAKKRKQSRSETVRNLIHNWIESNPNLLKSNYDIDLNDITREIEITDYDQVIQDSIQKLLKYSELFNEIEFDIIAEQLEISKKILRDIIFEHKNKLEKFGIKLRIRGKLIVKEQEGVILTSSKKLEKTNPEIIKNSYEKISEENIDISQLVIPFSKLNRNYKIPDVYSGREKIPFRERDPEYKKILRQEFVNNFNAEFKIFKSVVKFPSF